jgi:ABC-2 type transport system permease protein
LFVSWSLISRLAGMSFSQEGKSYWMLKSSPVSARGLITAKFFVAFIPGIVIGGAFLIVLSLLKSTPITSVVLSCLAVLFSIAGLVGLNLAFGVIGANFDWEDPRHMVKGVSGCLGALVSILFLLLCMVCFFGPAFVAEIFRLHPLVGYAIGLVLGISVSLAGGLIPLRLVYHRVSLLGEE